MFYTNYSRSGKNIYLRYKPPGQSETVSAVFREYSPTLYQVTDEEIPGGKKSIYGQNLKPMKFQSVNEAKDYVKRYKGVDGIEIHGNSNYENQFIIDLCEGKVPEFNEQDIKICYVDIEVYSPDEFPKPLYADHPINAITYYNSGDDVYYVFGLEYEGGGTFDIDSLTDDVREKLEDCKIEYFNFDCEESLLRSFLQMFKEANFDIITGWNSSGFDIPYIINRCNKILGEKFTENHLSPFGRISCRDGYDKFGNPEQKFDIKGLSHTDYMDMYKKHNFIPREEFSLGYIASEELGTSKIDYEEAQGLADLYKTNYAKFIAYNIVDVKVNVGIEKKRGFFSLTFAMAYYAMCNYEDTLGTVKIWEMLIAKFLDAKNIAPLFSRPGAEKVDYEGGWVKEPITGFWEWVFSVDLNSLYPHIEQQWNIGPETRIPLEELPAELLELKNTVTFNDILDRKVEFTNVLKKHNVTMSVNKEFYHLDKMSFFSEIKRELYTMRKKSKKLMQEAEKKKLECKADGDKVGAKKWEFEESKQNGFQLGLKILLNGGYGAVANSSFLYYLVQNAEAITHSGQLVNQWTSQHVEDNLKKMFGTKDTLWIYSDTDSAYYTLKPFVDTLGGCSTEDKVNYCDQFVEDVVSPLIKDRCQELSDYMNCYEQRMFWDREVISEVAIWFGKKKYIMSVNDSEGVRYKEPKHKFTGMESVKSSFPAWSREFLKQCYSIGLTGTESDMQEKLIEFRKQFEQFDTNDIAVPSGVNGIKKYSDEYWGILKGAQAHVKAAINHNRIVTERGLNKIPLLTDGNKIKYLYLKMPNPLGVDIIAYNGFIPKEFGIEKYIDKDKIYEKSFLAPLRIFTSCVNWSEEKKVTLF